MSGAQAAPDAMRAQLASAYAALAELQLNLHARDFWRMRAAKQRGQVEQDALAHEHTAIQQYPPGTPPTAAACPRSSAGASAACSAGWERKLGVVLVRDVVHWPRQAARRRVCPQALCHLRVGRVRREHGRDAHQQGVGGQHEARVVESSPRPPTGASSSTCSGVEAPEAWSSKFRIAVKFMCT